MRRMKAEVDCSSSSTIPTAQSTVAWFSGVFLRGGYEKLTSKDEMSDSQDLAFNHGLAERFPHYTQTQGDYQEKEE